MKTVSRWKTPRREPQKRENAPVDRFGEYVKAREAYLKGTSGPAGPCKRICPQTGEVIEIIEART